MNQVSTIREESLDFILLDGSSSMADKWWHALESLDHYVLGFKTQGVKSKLFLSVFASHVGVIDREEQIEDFKPLFSNPPGFPNTMTSLYDSIAHMGFIMRTLDPKKASIVIVSDGEDTSSKTTSLEQARKLLDWMRAKGWQITFIGCDFNNAKLAKLLGSNKDESIGVGVKQLADAAKELAKKRVNYARTGAPMHWSDADQQQFGGYLGKD